MEVDGGKHAMNARIYSYCIALNCGINLRLTDSYRLTRTDKQPLTITQSRQLAQ
jgi:hypothetical protein